MSTVKIYGHPVSPPTNVALTVARFLNVPFEFVFIDIMKGEQKNPDYASKTPA